MLMQSEFDAQFIRNSIVSRVPRKKNEDFVATLLLKPDHRRLR